MCLLAVNLDITNSFSSCYAIVTVYEALLRMRVLKLKRDDIRIQCNDDYDYPVQFC